MRLYGYFHSSAAYRVRIALGLKGLDWEDAVVKLTDDEQQGDRYRALNPQGLVPALETDEGKILGQSTAILEWLEEAHPKPPLYPEDKLERAHIRALCQHIACDIHPLNNLRVLRHLKQEYGQTQESVDRWYAHWILRGFAALEIAIAELPSEFSLNTQPGMLEVFLVPQVYNARRFAVPLDTFPAIQELDERCQKIPAFVNAHPLRQPDTPESLRTA